MTLPLSSLSPHISQSSLGPPRAVRLTWAPASPDTVPISHRACQRWKAGHCCEWGCNTQTRKCLKRKFKLLKQRPGLILFCSRIVTVDFYGRTMRTVKYTNCTMTFLWCHETLSFTAWHIAQRYKSKVGVLVSSVFITHICYLSFLFRCSPFSIGDGTSWDASDCLLTR